MPPQIINIPPRHLKTLCVSVAYTAWVLGNDPTRRVLVVAYSDELARIIARQFRQVVESPWYRQTFPRFAIKTNRSDEVVTTLNGFFRTRSINGSVLGTGADLIVIDDPIKGLDAALSQADVEAFVQAYTRHMEVEETHIAPMAMRLFSREQMKQLGDAMQEVTHED